MLTFVINFKQSEIIHNGLCYSFLDTVKDEKGIEIPVTKPKGGQRAAAMSVVSVIVRCTTLKQKTTTTTKTGWQRADDRQTPQCLTLTARGG